MGQDIDWKNKFPYFIESIQVESLLGKRDISWRLDDVNVLVGRNGSGKTTLLDLIKVSLFGPDGDSDRGPLPKKFEKIKITLNNGMTSSFQVESGDTVEKLFSMFLDSLRNNDESLEMSEINREQLKKVIESNESSPHKIEKYFMVGKSDFGIEQGNNQLLENINIEFISTFDMLLLSKEEIDEFSARSYSQLDIMINKEIALLAKLMLSLNYDTSKEYVVKKSDTDLKSIHNNKFVSINRFKEQVNRLFQPEGKRFSISKDGSLVIKYLGKVIDTRDLSSGEKQMLYILLKVVNSTDKPAIFFFDEPEISIHMSWQESLIDAIKYIHPNSQIVVVSHSPALVMKGWIDRLDDIDDLAFDKDKNIVW